MFDDILFDFFQFAFAYIGFGLGVFKVLGKTLFRYCTRGEYQLFEFSESFVDGNGLLWRIDTHNNGGFGMICVRMQGT